METSKQFLDESFSYRWLVNIKSSLDSLGDSHRSIDTQHSSSFIEMDPNCVSLCWTIDVSGSGFNLPRLQSSVINHPDQIFDGLLLPLTCPPTSEVIYMNSVLNKSESLNSSRPLLSQYHNYQSRSSASTSSSPFQSAHNTPRTTSSSSSDSLASRNAKFKSPIVKHCAGTLKKILWRYLCFLMPLCKKVKGLRLISSSSVKRCTNSVESSQKTTSSVEWCRSNADISIYDAILHCKRSNGQDK